MVTKVLQQTDAGPEPQLAAGERGHRGAGAGAAVERVRSRRGPGRLPDLHLGGLVEAAARATASGSSRPCGFGCGCPRWSR